MTKEEIVESLRNTRVFDGVHIRYTNSVSINGYLIKKPYCVTLANGREVMYFKVVQVNREDYAMYECQVYAQTVKDELLKKKHVCIVNLLGRLVLMRNGFSNIQVEEIAITNEFMNMNLLEN